MSSEFFSKEYAGVRNHLKRSVPDLYKIDDNVSSFLDLFAKKITDSPSSGVGLAISWIKAMEESSGTLLPNVTLTAVVRMNFGNVLETFDVNTEVKLEAINAMEAIEKILQQDSKLSLGQAMNKFVSRLLDQR